MKNKKKAVILPALFLLLAGCNGNKTSQSVNSSVVETPSEQIVSEKPKSSKLSTSGKTDTAGKTSASSSASQKVLWNKSARELRNLHFEGFYIPYVDIGKNYTTDWNDASSKLMTYRSIIGEKFDATKRTGFKATYLAEG